MNPPSAPFTNVKISTACCQVLLSFIEPVHLEQRARQLLVPACNRVVFGPSTLMAIAIPRSLAAMAFLVAQHQLVGAREPEPGAHQLMIGRKFFQDADGRQKVIDRLGRLAIERSPANLPELHLATSAQQRALVALCFEKLDGL